MINPGIDVGVLLKLYIEDIRKSGKTRATQ